MTVTFPEEEVITTTSRQHQPLYNVILMNDDDHSFEYVIRMLKELFAYSESRSSNLAMEVHNSGRAIVKTTTKEHAELKQEQIHAYGPDKAIKSSKGSMTCIIEPTE